MRIHNNELPGAATSGAGRSQDTQRVDREDSTPARGGVGSGGDRVEFSAGLGQLARAVTTHAAERAAKVESLTAMYQGGSYLPDSAAASRAMVSELLTVGLS